LKSINLASYFLHLLFNWGWKVAVPIFWHELKGEKKYNIKTSGFRPLSKFQIKGKELSSATEYMPVDYPLLESLLDVLPTTAKKGTFVDIGCGKGRALCVAAHFGFSKIEGIDFAKELVEEAKINLNSTQEIFPGLRSRVLWTDLESYKIPEETSCIFLFNPFNENMIALLATKILETNFLFPVHIIYASPVHLDAFEKAGFKMIKEIELLKPIKGAVLYRPNPSKQSI